MRIRDQAFWQQQKAENAQSVDISDRHAGEAFMLFVETWCDRAERVIAEGPGLLDKDPITPLQSLRLSLLPTESELGGLPPQWTAQMLLVIAASWELGGDELFEEMTVFEKKMVADMAALVNFKAQDVANQT